MSLVDLHKTYLQIRVSESQSFVVSGSPFNTILSKVERVVVGNCFGFPVVIGSEMITFTSSNTSYSLFSCSFKYAVENVSAISRFLSGLYVTFTSYGWKCRIIFRTRGVKSDMHF